VNAVPRSFRLDTTDRIRIAVDHAAGAAPAYVYLHGLASVRVGEKSEALRAHAAARGRAFWRFDLRGHGESDGQIGHATLSELVTDTLAILELSGPSILVGSSMGGLCAAFAAAAAGERVRGLVLLSPAFGYLPAMQQRLEPDGTLKTGSDRRIAMHPRVLADAAHMDEAALPSRLPMPVLMVHGTADEVVPHQQSERFFAAIPHAHKELWIVDGGDHRLNREVLQIYARMDRLLG
jgi:pimeloyl-ACP methyl ester carboxylesterase